MSCRFRRGRGASGRPVSGESVRLPADVPEIERIAAQAGVPVGALIRGWVLAGLAAERGTSLRDAIEHLAEKHGDCARRRREEWPEA